MEIKAISVSLPNTELGENVHEGQSKKYLKNRDTISSASSDPYALDFKVELNIFAGAKPVDGPNTDRNCVQTDSDCYRTQNDCYRTQNGC